MSSEETAAPVPPSAAGPPLHRFILRALAHRNFHLFFLGQSVSLIGTWMQQVAVALLVFHLTTSAFLLGAVGFASNAPIFLLTPFAGLLSDRWGRRGLLLVGQALLMLQAVLLTWLTLDGTITIGQVLALSVFAGLANAICFPTLQAFLIDMVEDRADVGSAIGLNSFMNNAARMLGPAAGGTLIGWLTAEEGGVREAAGLCFLLNAVSFLGALGALAAMRVPSRPTAVKKESFWQGLKEGFTYTLGFPPSRTVLLLLAVTGLVTVPYNLMPLVASDMLHGDASTVGLLMSADGVGAIAGGIFLASRRSNEGTARRIALSAVAASAVAFAFSFVGLVWLALVLRVALAFFLMVQIASINTLLQLLTEDAKRGRVMALYTLSLLGMMPLGSLLMGGVSELAGLEVAFQVNGLCMLAASLWLLVRLPRLDPLIRERCRSLALSREPRASEP